MKFFKRLFQDKPEVDLINWDWGKCLKCDGKGVIGIITTETPISEPYLEKVVCDQCNGFGKIKAKLR